MNYRQSIYDIQVEFKKNSYDYSSILINGERDEYEKKINIKTGKNILDNINFFINTNELKDINNQFIKYKSILSKNNIDCSVLLKLHNEKILINNTMDDERSYGFFRVSFKNQYGLYSVKEIPILERQKYDLKNNMVYHLERFLNNYKERIPKGKVKFQKLPHVFSPQAAGFFLHEIIGHTLEEDNYLNSSNIYYNRKISKNLTVIDAININNNLVGISKIDDLGIPIKPITLIEDGKVNNIIATKKIIVLIIFYMVLQEEILTKMMFYHE